MVALIKIPPEEILGCSATMACHHETLTAEQQSLDAVLSDSSEAWTGAAGETFLQNATLLDAGFVGIIRQLGELNRQLLATKDLLQAVDSQSVWPQPAFTTQSRAGE